MQKSVNGKLVDLSAAEIAVRQAEEVAWAAGQARRDAEAAILALEASISDRRQREAVLGDAVALAFIQDVEAQIAALRPLVV
ncbi:hypothetical protein [Magnetovibrio blakemorei]|uniref:Uncharacterized protein n=1 Tax=Magnetovibrio blakemorei TaxID=28181 RepID=A0A1E5Q4D5_9PROT|nr:hypothetical protein [Magnetovibrio blakemorei]OEJ64647.1 hypothetical protein BEN30_00720 [Magnetovibrio blakemorei]